MINNCKQIINLLFQLYTTPISKTVERRTEKIFWEKQTHVIKMFAWSLPFDPETFFTLLSTQQVMQGMH
jgi:hypothetical protein